MVDIYLRALCEKDAPICYQWFNDRDVTDTMNKGIWPNSVDAQKEHFRALAQSRSDVQFGIQSRVFDSKITSGLIGTIGIHKIDWVHRRGDVSVVIGNKNHWGKGAATQAIRLIVHHGFLKMNLRKLTAGMWASNVGSRRAFEKNGFVLEGSLKENYHHRGQYVDELRYGLLRSAWEEEKQ